MRIYFNLASIKQSYKGVFLIMLLSLISCNQRTFNKDNPLTGLKPDLAVRSIRINDSGYLAFTLHNDGQANIPNGEQGWVYVYANEQLITRLNIRYDLNSDLGPGENLQVETNFSLPHAECRIAIIIDPENLIDESNEYQNSRHQTFVNDEVEDVNVKITDLDRSLTSSLLLITVQNNGLSPTEASNAIVHVIKNISEEQVFNVPFPALTVGESHSFGVSTGVTDNDKIEVSFLLEGQAEKTLFDNFRREWPVRLDEDISAPIDIIPYATLLENPGVKPYVNWESPNGVENYENWSFSRKHQLFELLRQLEVGHMAEVTDLEIIGESTDREVYYSQETALQLYMRGLAIALWVEVHGLTEWSILDYRDSHRTYLLDSRRMLRVGNSLYFLNAGNKEKVNPWNPYIYYQFLRIHRLTKSQTRITIDVLLNWMIGHYSHISVPEESQYSDFYGIETNLVPLKRIMYPLPGMQYDSPGGCVGVSGSLNFFLKAINIPMNQGRWVGQNPINDIIGTHHRPEFITEGLALLHGDDIYSQHIVPSGAPIDLDRLLVAQREANNLTNRPRTDCDPEGLCNTIYQQATYNSSRSKLQMAITWLSDGILATYDPDNPEALDQQLTGPSYNIGPTQFALPYYSEEARTSIQNLIEDHIREVGEGEVQRGLDIINERLRLWYLNKRP